MKTPALDEDSLQHASAEEIHSALFAQLVTGHAQMAMRFLGRYPDPETGQTEPPEPATAKVFIDQLEMIGVKTRGNLTAEEARLLARLLDAAHHAFTEVLEAPLTAGDDPPVNLPPLDDGGRAKLGRNS